MGVNNVCNFTVKFFIDFPCSINVNLPLGFKILNTSLRAISGLRILQRLHVDTTKSIELSASGIFSAENCIYSTGNETPAIRDKARSYNSRDGSSAYNLIMFL